MTGTLSVVQSQIGDMFMQIAGNPVFLGVIVIVVFLVWVFMSGMKVDGKLLILTGAMFLAFGMLPVWVQIALGILAGVLLALAILKVLNR